MSDFEIEGDDQSGSGFLDTSWNNDSIKPKAISPKANVGGKLGSSLFGGTSAAVVGSKFGAAAAGGGDGGDEYDFEVKDYAANKRGGRRQKSPVEKKGARQATKVVKAVPFSKDMTAMERAEAI